MREEFDPWSGRLTVCFRNLTKSFDIAMTALPDWEDLTLGDFPSAILSRNLHSTAEPSRAQSSSQSRPQLAAQSIDPVDSIRKPSHHDASNIEKQGLSQSVHDMTDLSALFNTKYDSEIFSYRELMLLVSDSCRLYADFINRIEDHIVTNGDIDEKAVQSLQRFVFEFTQPNSSRGSVYEKLLKRLPREATLLYESEKKLEQLVDKMLKSFVECMKTRKEVYSSQIKKTRDQCNLAIRQALQVNTCPVNKTKILIKSFNRLKRLNPATR